MAAHFPLGGDCGGGGGTGLTTSALLSTPKHPLCSGFCSGLSPQRPDTPTHLLGGLEVDALSQSGLAVPRRKSPVLTLAGRKTCCFCFGFFPQSFLFARPLRDHECHDIISSGHFPWPVPPQLGCLVSHMTTECGRQTAREVVGGGQWLLPAASTQTLKESAGSHQSASAFHNS